MSKDILLEDNGSFKVENGDLVVDESTSQEVSLILTSFKGNWKQHPFIGVGIDNYIQSPQTASSLFELEHEIKRQLTLDNKVSKVRVDGLENITIDARNKL